jgi:hypothetical protein
MIQSHERSINHFQRLAGLPVFYSGSNESSLTPTVQMAGQYLLAIDNSSTVVIVKNKKEIPAQLKSIFRDFLVILNFKVLFVILNG